MACPRLLKTKPPFDRYLFLFAVLSFLWYLSLPVPGMWDSGEEADEGGQILYAVITHREGKTDYNTLHVDVS